MSLDSLDSSTLRNRSSHIDKVNVSSCLGATKFNRRNSGLRLVVHNKRNLGQHMLKRHHNGIDRRSNFLFLAGYEIRRTIT